jgi:hypothetical protein
MPASILGYKDVDPADVDIRTLFSQIAIRHEAKIQTDEAGSVITVKATNRAKAKDVIADLQKQLLYRPGEESVWSTQLLVLPPKNGKDHFSVVLRSKEGDPGVRAIAREADHLEPVNADDVTADTTEYKIALRNVLDRTAGILRHSPNGMRMRVQFGSLLLDEWKKDKPDYNFFEFGKLARRVGARGTTRMINM